MTARLTDEICARCDLHLATSNRHPDRFCGACQHDLASYRDRRASPGQRAWISAGRPRIVRGGKRPETTRPAPALDLLNDLIGAVARELLQRPEARDLLRRRIADEIAGLAGLSPS